MNKNTCFSGGVRVLTMIPWRRDTSAFMGETFEYGLYKVVASRDQYDVTHGGRYFGTFSEFIDAEDAIRRHIEHNN